MKTCPACHKTYEDDSMTFCLVDGARLLDPTTAVDPNATHVLPPPRVTEPGPTIAAPQAAPQPTLRAEPELMRMSPRAFTSTDRGLPERSRSHTLPWVLGIVIVLGVFGVIIALILTRNRSEPSQQIVQTSTPSPSPANSGSPTSESEPSPAVQQEAAFGPLMDNTSFNGTNLTYYPRTSPGLCEADCARNANCRGFTWIKPGAYNPGDSAMCYLISYVSGKVSHPCCMSAVKN